MPIQNSSIRPVRPAQGKQVQDKKGPLRSEASKSQNSAPTTMAQLLASHKSSLVSLSRGQIVSGTITKLSSNEILLDIGAKTEAVAIEKDKNLLNALLGSLSIGDKVEASVISPESEMGYPLVSLRNFVDKKTREKARLFASEKKPIGVTVNEMTRGGFLVSGEGMSGFLPNSHIIGGSEGLLGQKIIVNVLEVNPETKKIIFSQKSTLTQADFQASAVNLKPGDKVLAKVINTAPFGVFFSLPSATQTPLEGFVHSSEISWEEADLSHYRSGQEAEVKVLGLDRDNKRVNLSIKRLTSDPFEEILKEFAPDKKIKATISKITSSGITLDLGNGIEGVIKKEKVPPNSNYEVGREISATVVEVDSLRHKITLVPVLLEKPMGYR